MPRVKGGKSTSKRHIERYEHTDKTRINNPPAGLVTAETDPPLPTHKTYDYVAPVPSVKPRQELDYDPHLDPQLVWAGKKEHSSFEVPTVSLHVHERIDPSTIIEAVRKTNGNALSEQPSLFERREENPPLREAIDFYRHAHGWSNRLVAGDSLLVMNSLLEKEGMAGQVQMVYIDPPYGIKYGSNFQPFVNKRDVKDGKDDDLTQEPEMIRAFRDTWQLGIHSYLSYLRDRLLLARDLLNATGSCFVQIGETNLHLVRNLMDDIFRSENFMSLITFRAKNMPFGAKYLENMYDHLLWYAKNQETVKFRKAFVRRRADPTEFSFIEMPDGSRRRTSAEERTNPSLLPEGARLFSRLDLYSSGYTPTCIYEYEFEGTIFRPETGKSWKTTREGMAELERQRRLMKLGSKLYFIFFFDDYPLSLLTNFWDDTAGGFPKQRNTS
jgi:adenine-specific DNA-methyltransferase